VKIRWLHFAVIAAAAATIGLSVTAGASAPARTPSIPHPAYWQQTDNCPNGEDSGYCGSQVNADNEAITATPYGALIVTPYKSKHTWYQVTPEQEFGWHPFDGNDGLKIAMYEPDGIPSDFIMAQVHNRILLVPGPETITANDEWTYNGAGDWQNAGTGDYIGVDSHGQIVPVSSATANNWVFDTP
jgi:hypothetical protein